MQLHKHLQCRDTEHYRVVAGVMLRGVRGCDVRGCDVKVGWGGWYEWCEGGVV